MHSNFTPARMAELGKRIEKLERAELVGKSPYDFDPADLFDEQEQTFVRIEGLANFWHLQPGVEFAQHITDLVIGAHNLPRTTLTVVLEGSPQQFSIYISLGKASSAQALLEGIFPGIRLAPTATTKLAQRLHSHFQVKGMLTGIPNRKGSEPANSSSSLNESTSTNHTQQQKNGAVDVQGLSQLERVIRGMHKATWAYVVKADPRQSHMMEQERYTTLLALAEVASLSRIQLQSTQTDNQQKTDLRGSSTTTTSSGEMVNYHAQYLVRLLERELERLDQASGLGQWTVETYFGASNIHDLQRLASLLRGTLAGKDSRPIPLRSHICSKGGEPIDMFATYLTSEELATLIQFPREEVPGYAIHDFVRFDVDLHSLPASSSSSLLSLGHIQQNGKDTADTYTIPIHDLTKHGVVVGVTGSGKTTTVMNLLDRLVDAKKPFLVIEPAKTEYRALHGVLAGRESLRIYTLGNETVAPFRLNPFEFETDDDPENSSLLNHIDFLKAVFNAAFILYAPMPYILETALHEVYEDKGWDLARGINTRLPDWKKRNVYPVFPTLTDLYHKIEAVTNRLHYDREIEQNVKAGLKARIGAMRLGSKGFMLDTARGIPMHELLSKPAILEMESIGGDEEKTFLMGLLLAKIYEYRRLQASSGVVSLSGNELQHLIVFEEAHRLLKNTTTSVDTESSNMRAQAIEVFTNMLSEVRGYGQGVLVAEQIPSKLAPDVLKNTNLKVIHRLIAQDDRESVGQTMNLNADQMTHLGILFPGMAAIYAEGADHAYLVRLDNYKKRLTPLKNADLKQISPQYISVDRYQTIPEMIHRYNIKMRPTAFGGPDTTVYSAASKVLETEQSRWLWASILLRATLNLDKLPSLLQTLERHIEREMSSLPINQRHVVLEMAVIQGCAETLRERGTYAGWTYPVVDELCSILTQGLLALVRKTPEVTNSYLDRFTHKYTHYLEQRKYGPFAGCVHCQVPCRYRADMRHLLLSGDSNVIGAELKKRFDTPDERYAAVSKVATALARRWTDADTIVIPDIAYCSALHAVSELGYTEYEQTSFSTRLKPHLLK